MAVQLVEWIERLNLAHHQSFVGGYFSEIVALLSIIFGGSFLLFGWKHHEYYLGMTGFLVGGWAGLILKNHLAPAGTVVPPFLYLGVCAVAGGFVAVQFRQFVGILLGGFSVAVAASALFPKIFRPGEHGLVTASAAFLMGGGLGAMFPKFFFVFNSSLIGSVFVTYGVSGALLTSVAGGANPQVKVMLHLLVFLPLLLFGVLYQMVTSQREETPVAVAQPAPPQPQPVR